MEKAAKEMFSNIKIIVLCDQMCFKEIPINPKTNLINLFYLIYISEHNKGNFIKALFILMRCKMSQCV